MSIIKHFLAICFISLLLSACSTLSKKECLNADWHEIGYEDGAAGKKRSRYAKHAKACTEYKIVANKSRYMQGREKGLRSYCSPENALQVGLNGSSYDNVCPQSKEPAFFKKYRQGKAIYTLDSQITQHESRISSLEYKLKKKADKLSEEEKKDFRQEIDHLEIRIEEKSKQLYYLKGQADL